VRLPLVRRRGRGPLAGRGRRGCAEEREAGLAASGCVHAERGVHVERGVCGKRNGELVCSRGEGCSRGAGVFAGSGCVHVKARVFT